MENIDFARAVVRVRQMRRHSVKEAEVHRALCAAGLTALEAHMVMRAAAVVPGAAV